MLQITFVSTQNQSNQKPPFNTRKLKKNDPRFLEDYNRVEYTWALYRFLYTEMPANEGVRRMPQYWLSDTIGNETIIEALNACNFAEKYKLSDRDCLIVEKQYVFPAIKNARRPDVSSYLRLLYIDNAWIAEAALWDECELIDKGKLLIAE